MNKQLINSVIRQLGGRDSLQEFKAWSGAVETQERIIEAGKTEEFESYIEELYPDGLTDTQLNDILWFEEESVFEYLGIEVEG